MKAYFYDIDKCCLTIGDLEDFQSEEISEVNIKSGYLSYQQNKDYLEYVGLCLADLKCCFSNNILLELFNFLKKQETDNIINEYYKTTYKDNSCLSISVKENEVRIKIQYENEITDEDINLYYDINNFYDVFVMYYIRSMFYNISGTYDKSGNDILIHPDDKFPEPIGIYDNVKIWSNECVSDLYSYYINSFNKLVKSSIIEVGNTNGPLLIRSEFDVMVKFYKQTGVVKLWNDFNIPLHIGITIHLLHPWEPLRSSQKVTHSHIITIVHFKEWVKKLELS